MELNAWAELVVDLDARITIIVHHEQPVSLSMSFHQKERTKVIPK